MPFLSHLPQKQVADQIRPVFDFAPELFGIETVSSAQVTATVYSGEDSTPSLLISGVATVSSPLVNQLIIGGLNGVIYLLNCAATLSSGRIVNKLAYLAVVNSPSP